MALSEKRGIPTPPRRRQGEAAAGLPPSSAAAQAATHAAGHPSLSARALREGVRFKNTHQRVDLGFVSTNSRRARQAPRGRWTVADE